MNSLKYEFQLKNFCFVDCAPEQFYRCQWTSKYAHLACWKLFGFIYWLAWVVIAHASPFEEHPKFVYLTHWGTFTICLYCLTSSCTVLYGIYTVKLSPDATTTEQRENSSRDNNVESGKCEQTQLDGSNLRWYHKITWVLHVVAFDAACVITALYFALIRPINTAADGVNAHVINTLFMLLDSMIMAVPVRLLHFYHTCNFAVVYLLFTVVLHGSGYISSVYTDVLDWENLVTKSAVISVLAACLACPLMHLVNFAVYKLRMCIYRAWSGRRGSDVRVHALTTTVA